MVCLLHQNLRLRKRFKKSEQLWGICSIIPIWKESCQNLLVSVPKKGSNPSNAAPTGPTVRQCHLLLLLSLPSHTLSCFGMWLLSSVLPTICPAGYNNDLLVVWQFVKDQLGIITVCNGARVILIIRPLTHWTIADPICFQKRPHTRGHFIPTPGHNAIALLSYVLWKRSTQIE